MIKRLFFLFILLLFSVSAVYANKTLNEFYQNTQSMEANFEQIIINSQGLQLEQSQGNLILSRPDKFILNYQTPAEQLYISNGKTIWIYDVELEQVSIKALDEGVGNSPALLLSSNKNIYQHYHVEDVIVSRPDNLQWVQLTSKAPEMTFERVLLAFNENFLMGMRLYDSFGQVTELKFSKVKINSPISDNQFEFIPPDNVDVIGSVNAK